MKVYISFLFILLSSVSFGQTTSDIWVNEFHYDGQSNYGQTDNNEFVEIAVKTSIATNAVELAKYKLVLYTSGAYDQTAYTLGKGLPYNISSSWYSLAETEFPLNSFQSCVVPGSAFTLLSKTLPVLQDVPAAFAIVYNNTTVVQLLSYEKSFKMASAAQNGGAAAGMTTQLITKADNSPAMETATTPNTHSVSLLGSGTTYSSFTWEDGATVTATPCALNTNTVTTQSFSGPLPVKWISVQARPLRDNIVVQWLLASEQNVKEYVVELADYRGSFAAAGSLKYAKNNNGSYQFTIPGKQPGTYNVRIKSVALDGQVEYSETRTVKLTGHNAPFVSVYPNPVQGGVVNVQLIASAKTSYTLEITDVNGKRITSMVTPVLQPNTLNKFDLPLKAAAGIYQLKIISGSDQQAIKIVVL